MSIIRVCDSVTVTASAMDTMKSYLAEKYMSGPKADAILAKTAQKKKKRKTNTTTTSGANLVDEDGPPGWVDTRAAEDADDLTDAVVEKDRAFKKRRKDAGSGWATIRDGEAGPDESNANGQREASPVPADEQPQVVAPPAFTGGLISASDLHKVMPKTAPMRITQEEVEAAKETVYRDKQGRKIDTKAARAEAARKKREREEKEAAMMEWGKGLVQREEKEKMRQELEKQKGKAFSRHIDDADLNEEMKAKQHWNDPAAGFLMVRVLVTSHWH